VDGYQLGEKTISVRFKPTFGFKPKDYEERTIAVCDTLLALPPEVSWQRA